MVMNERKKHYVRLLREEEKKYRNLVKNLDIENVYSVIYTRIADAIESLEYDVKGIPQVLDILFYENCARLDNYLEMTKGCNIK